MTNQQLMEMGNHRLMHREVSDDTGIAYLLYIRQDEIPRNYEFYKGEPKLNVQIANSLRAGEMWAWASVTVVAEYAGFKGEAFLGGCSYRDTAEFLKYGYWSDLKADARYELITEVDRMASAAGIAMTHLRSVAGKE